MKKPILFIDQDGTLIKEIPVTYQLDAWEKLKFMPNVFTSLSKIAALKRFHFVLVSNQDGLGSDNFPTEPFKSIHKHILETLACEGITFDDVYIDPSWPAENSPNRKPSTGMLGKYLNPEFYDLENSFVIGDRWSDMQLAKNIGCKGIYLKHAEAYEPSAEEQAKMEAANPEYTVGGWQEIENLLLNQDRRVVKHRKTKETDILIDLNLDGSGQGTIDTGLKFFDHMLDQIKKHAQVDLSIKVEGDLEIDEHHTIEDTALTLGAAFKEALGEKVGAERYGYALPMDECLAQVAIDFGGRPWIVWEAEFNREKVGDLPTEMFFHFFKSFSDAAQCNLNIKVEGDNEHHKIESIFKALAKSIKMAKQLNLNQLQVPSSKGVL